MQSRHSRMLLQWVAVVIATSCVGDASDSDEQFGPIPPSNAEEHAITDLTYAIKRDLDVLRNRPMSDEQKAQLDAAEARVRRALADLRDTHQRGAYRGVAMARIGGVSAALVADDATVVGVADDGLLILCGIAAVVAIVSTSAAASPQQLKKSWDELHSSLLELDAAITAVTAEVCTNPIDLAHHTDQSQANAKSEAESTARATSEPLVDSNRRYGRNQKCSNDKLSKLQGIANSICKSRGQNTCSSSKVSARRLAKLKCSEVLRRQAHHEACLAARRQVQKSCFHSTDSGHARAIDNRIGAVGLCKELAVQQCAPDSRYNDQ